MLSSNFILPSAHPCRSMCVCTLTHMHVRTHSKNLAIGSSYSWSGIHQNINGLLIFQENNTALHQTMSYCFAMTNMAIWRKWRALEYALSTFWSSSFTLIDLVHVSSCSVAFGCTESFSNIQFCSSSFFVFLIAISGCRCLNFTVLALKNCSIFCLMNYCSSVLWKRQSSIHA